MDASSNNPFLFIIYSETVMPPSLRKGFFLCYFDRTMIGLLVDPTLNFPLDRVFLTLRYELAI